MRRWLFIAALLLIPSALPGQELTVEGGRAVLSIIPDTVVVTDTVTIALPPDTVVVTLPPDTIQLPPDTVFVTDTVEVCPEGWTCTPPPEPEPTVALVRQDSGAVSPGGSVRVVLAMDSVEIARTRVVEFYLNGTSVRNEYVPAYCLGGGDSDPCNPQTIPASATEIVVEAKRYLRDGSPVETYRLEIPVNPTEPPAPPDTTPPAPGDSVPPPPPPPPDSIIGTITLGTPTNIRWETDAMGGLEIAWDPIPEDTVTTCVSCGTWWERQAVINDPDVVGDDIYYAMGAWEGAESFNPDAAWWWQSDALASNGRSVPASISPPPDTVTVCVRAEAWDALSHTAENPGGGYVTQFYPRYNFSRIVPVSEINCTTLIK